jgi:hypothetical protein
LLTRLTIDRFRQLQERLRDPLLTALTILLAIYMFVLMPLQAIGVLAAHYFAIALAPAFIAAIFVVARHPAAVMALIAALAAVVASTLLRLRQPSIVDVYLEAGAWLVIALTLGIVVTRAVFAPGRISFHRIIGAILLYLSIGIFFMALFCFIALMTPNAFSGFGPLQDTLAITSRFIYFSFVTLTSVGYGDIVPVHPFARSVANIEAIIGQLYPATLLARLVTLELQDGATADK